MVKQKNKSKVKSAQDSVKPVTEKKQENNQVQPSQNHENQFITFLFGHPVINKKDIIEIGILLILSAFLIFMQLKLKNII